MRKRKTIYNPKFFNYLYLSMAGGNFGCRLFRFGNLYIRNKIIKTDIRIMKKHTILINGNEYKIKQNIRSMFLWESITNRAFELKTMLDSYLYYYCIILANNPDSNIDWDEYLDYINEHPKLIVEITTILGEANKLDELTADENEKGKGSKKNFSKRVVRNIGA